MMHCRLPHAFAFGTFALPFGCRGTWCSAPSALNALLFQDHVDGSNEQALIGAQTAQVSLSEVKCTQPLSNVEPATGIQ